jgi:hypothetical protein
MSTSTLSCESSCPDGTYLVLDNLNGEINICLAADDFDSAWAAGTATLARVSLFA